MEYAKSKVEDLTRLCVKVDAPIELASIYIYILHTHMIYIYIYMEFCSNGNVNMSNLLFTFTRMVI